MSKIVKRRPGKSWWETQAMCSHKSARREICLALLPDTILMRLKGTRRVLTFPIARLYLLTAELQGKEDARLRREDREKRSCAKKGVEWKPRRVEVRRGALVRSR